MATPAPRLLMRLVFWGALAVAYVCALLPSAPGIVRYDKGNHAIAFATLAILARIGWPQVRAWRQGVALVLFGGAIELSQALPMIHRDASWADVYADALATCGGLAAATALIAAVRHLAGGRLPPAGDQPRGPIGVPIDRPTAL